jgi:hypothetical protein
MLDLKKLFENFDSLSFRLFKKGTKKETLLTIKEK